MDIDRCFDAFGAGTLKSELCNGKVRNLRTRMEELEGGKRGREARREQLEIPAIDREVLASVSDNFGNPAGRQGNTLRNPERGDDSEGDEPVKKAPSPPGGEEGADS